MDKENARRRGCEEETAGGGKGQPASGSAIHYKAAAAGCLESAPAE